MTKDEHVLRLAEHRSATLEDAWVQAVPASFWEQTETTVSRTPGQDGWSVQAESYVGVARVSTALGHLTLHVSPKLEGCDSFFLADYAYGQRHQPLRQLPGEQALVDQVRNDPAACLLLWHVLAVHRFSARWLRRDQITLTQDLHGKVKGSIQLSRYITKHVALADAATVPCRVRERTQDTPNNRILKAGLRRAALLAASLPVPGARRAVRAAVNAALPRFAQVADVPGSPRDLRGTSTKGPLRHYTEVLNATINFLQGNYLSGDLGTTGTTAFLWSMPTLFQEALRGVLSEASSLHLLEDVPTATIHDAQGTKKSSSKVDPDYVVVRPDGSILLLDAKYKNAAGIGSPAVDLVEVPGARRIRVPRSDIYQMAAYRQHDRWTQPTGALVYPISLLGNEDLPAPYQVRGFGEPIYICFIDVGPSARGNLPAFLAHASALATGNLSSELPVAQLGQFAEVALVGS
ncbi:hypothetical protein BJF86_13315 [Serinicoccus sp. CNJ-927]|uniref:5-methylcytosine restriction system specificity protein McrC n=1 Tax=Serinicoccus sp. CNJ-927 TaxID=1904970 RepID=UPI00096731B6|nr:hypothetical protein [Serinicoccus sp. CNJ-927]OLT43933.1 hypothetical protein BJF86_13315 [Serinicoccus sp. CNJ-927]